MHNPNEKLRKKTDDEEKVVYRLRKRDIPAFRKIYGAVLKGDKILELKKIKGAVYAVGDRVSYEVLNSGLNPRAIFYDGYVERRKSGRRISGKIESFRAATKIVKNKAGTVTSELLGAVRKITSGGKRMKIFVVGEEDLAVLALAALARAGDSIVYGMRKKGMCVLRVDKNIKMVARRILYG